jgi:hypothetical protein
MRHAAMALVAVLVASMTAAPIPDAVAGAAKMVTIVNGTHRTMVEFYAQTPGSGDADWFDRLGEGAIKPGESAVVDFGTDDNCVYDLAGVFEGGRKIYKYRVNVCAVSSYRFTEADGPS